LVWDNIPRGVAIGCASIEKALTAEIYCDRVLGVSEYITVPAQTIHNFTGNNISGRGDLASRTLGTHIDVSRPDPANRPFEHPDPIGWTQANRGKIPSALYIILLGNPRRWRNDLGPAKTRFKAWWDLAGSAVEHAAQQHVEQIHHSSPIRSRAVRRRRSTSPPGLWRAKLAMNRGSASPACSTFCAADTPPGCSPRLKSPPSLAAPRTRLSPSRALSKWRRGRHCQSSRQ
jgi:hypothetical protein